MRIGFDARVLAPGRVGGTRTYALGLLRALVAARPTWEILLYTDAPLDGAARDLLRPGSAREVPVTAGRNPSWVQLQLVRALHRDRPDVFHSPGYFAPVACPVPVVVTVHDTNFFAHPGRWQRQGRVSQWLDLAVQTPLALARADVVITESEDAERRLRRWFPWLRRVAVTPYAPDPFFDGTPSSQEVASARGASGAGDYLLAVGAGPEKRLETILVAMASSPAAWESRLVVVGATTSAYRADLGRLARDLGLGDAPHFAGAVPDGVLRALYQGALCLVAAGDGEGFGLPVVEAMACGTPVLAANRAALPEVLGDAGWLFDPDQPHQLGDLVARLLADPDARRALSARGLARRRAFSWERTAELTIQAYEAAASR